MQLRPSQNNLGACGSKRKNNATADAEATVKPEEPSGKKAAGSSKKQVDFCANSVLFYAKCVVVSCPFRFIFPF